VGSSELKVDGYSIDSQMFFFCFCRSVYLERLDHEKTNGIHKVFIFCGWVTISLVSALRLCAHLGAISIRVLDKRNMRDVDRVL